MIDLQTVSIVFASASVVAAVIYYSLVVRHQSRQIQHQTTLRQTDLILRLQGTWESRELTNAVVAVMNMKSEDIDTWAKRYPFRHGLSEPHVLEPETFPMIQLANFFNVVGILLHRKLIDIEMVDEMFSFYIKIWWEKMKPVIEA